MLRHTSIPAVLLIASAAVQRVSGQATQQGHVTIRPDSARFSEVLNGRATVTDFRGRRAVKLVPAPEMLGKDADMLAILAGSRFKDGTIDVDVAGAPREGAAADARGFIGLAFRTGEPGGRAGVSFLRPTKGRADDRLRRDDSGHYMSRRACTWRRALPA